MSKARSKARSAAVTNHRHYNENDDLIFTLFEAPTPCKVSVDGFVVFEDPSKKKDGSVHAARFSACAANVLKGTVSVVITMGKSEHKMELPTGKDHKFVTIECDPKGKHHIAVRQDDRDRPSSGHFYDVNKITGSMTLHVDEAKKSGGGKKKAKKKKKKLLPWHPKPGSRMAKKFWDKVARIKAQNPGNRCVRYLSKDFYSGLSPENQAVFYKCIKTGIDNVNSGLGCYAMKPSDYDVFADFFDQVILDYHNGTKKSRHKTDWDISTIGDNGVLDVTKLGLPELSMRVRVGRNLDSFNLPGLMDREERIAFEKTLMPAFDKLKAKMGGTVYSLSPDHGDGAKNPNLISNAKYQELVDAHVMFKDMDADPFLKSAGISSDFPYGRGCWQSEDKECIVWFGEEDQLRIMSMKKGTCLNEVFNKLKMLLDTFESIDGISFAKSRRYGYVTSCPSNLGTGMRASVHIKVPNLTKDGTDAKAKEVCNPLGLSVRGTGGEHTPIGADGTIDVSPRARLFIKEKQIVAKLYKGIQDLMAAEKAAA